MSILEVEKTGVVWTGNHAIPAAHTSVMIHNHNPVLTLICCLNRANLSTRWVFTLVAQKDNVLFLNRCSNLILEFYLSYPVNIPAVVIVESDIVFKATGSETFRTI